MNTRIPSLENELASLRVDVQSRAGTLNSFSTEVQTLQKELASKKQEIKELQQSLSSQQNQNQIQLSQLTALQKELDSSHKKIDEYSKQVILLQSQLNAKATPSPSSLPSLTNQLQSLQQQLNEMQKTSSEKDIQIMTLESKLKTNQSKLQEALTTLQQLESSYDQLKQNRDSPNVLLLQEQLATVKMEKDTLVLQYEQEKSTLQLEKKVAEDQRNQYSQLYSTNLQQLEAKNMEVVQLKQQIDFYQQEKARTAVTSATPSLDSTLKQYLITIQQKDQKIIQLESEKQQLSLALSQAKKETEIAYNQAKQADSFKAQIYSNQDSATVLELRSQLLAKQQEIASLQKQLQVEMGLVQTLKASFLEIDSILNSKLNNQNDALPAILKAKEDHNQYLEKMVASLEAQINTLQTQQNQFTQQQQSTSPLPSYQSLIAVLSTQFPDVLITPSNLQEYLHQLCLKLQDEKKLYSSLQQQYLLLEKEKNDLSQKVLVLQQYANGHNQIDKKADSFIQDLIRQRNDYEQLYKTATFESEKKETEIKQLKRSLKQEKETNIKMLKKQSSSPTDIPELLEECVQICQLAKVKDNHKLDSVSDITETLKLVRRGITSMLNLFKRENERLHFENKRLKETTEKNKQNEEKTNKKIKEIIRVIQNQGVALTEFVTAFRNIQK